MNPNAKSSDGISSPPSAPSPQSQSQIQSTATSTSSPSIYSTMMASALSGMLVRIPLHPIDTCKAKLQVQRTPPVTATATSTASTTGSSSIQYTSLRDCFRQTLRHEGLRGLYAGFPITFIGSAPAACLYFTSYELNKSFLASVPILNSTEFAVHFAAGLLAECFSCVLWVPIDVVKERQQVQSNLKALASSATATSSPKLYRNTFDALITIARTEGLRGIYRGYGATVASFGPYSALYLSLYEKSKIAMASILSSPNPLSRTSSTVPTKPLSTSDLPFYGYLLSGGFAGGIAAILTNPLDLIKLRLQVQRGKYFHFNYNNLVHGLITIVREEGAKTLLKGATARCAFYVPSSALSIALFDTIKNTLQRWNDGR